MLTATKVTCSVFCQFFSLIFLTGFSQAPKKTFVPPFKRATELTILPSVSNIRRISHSLDIEDSEPEDIVSSTTKGNSSGSCVDVRRGEGFGDYYEAGCGWTKDKTPQGSGRVAGDRKGLSLDYSEPPLRRRQGSFVKLQFLDCCVMNRHLQRSQGSC